MEMTRTGLQRDLDVAAAIAPLRRIVQRGLSLELLHRLWVGQRDVVQDGKIEIVRVDSFELEVVVHRALPVDVDADGAAAQGGGVGHFRIRSCRKREQRKEITRGQGKLADVLDRLPSRR